MSSFCRLSQRPHLGFRTRSQWSSFMPQRPRSHVTADQAMTAVGALFEQAGHAVERVQNDYGEDLLVQTAHAGQMDALRIWIQVKGTDDLQRHQLASGMYRFQFPADHVRRWMRTNDTILVVLWDVERALGVYTHAVYDDVLALLTQRSVTLRFDANRSLTRDSVEDIVWNARVHHLDSLIRCARSIDREVLVDGYPDVLIQRVGASAIVVAIDFLQMVGIVERVGDAFALNEDVRSK